MSEIRTRTVQANGLSFVVDEAGEGDAVALFLHGFPESRRSWRAQLPALAALGWRAVAPDLRGYGNSSRPKDRTAYRLEHLTADVAALFDALGARRRLLIGHDWGGIIAWAFAAERVQVLDGLIIMNAPHPAAYIAYMRGHPAQWLRSWYVLFFQLPWLPEAGILAMGARGVRQAFGAAANPAAFPPELLDHYAQAAQAPGAMTAMINYYRANTGMLRRWGPAPPMIEVPTLMIWGEEDSALGIENTEGYEDLVRDFTLRRLPGVSHWVQQEAPERVNAILTDWLARRPRPAT